ncbi:MAG: hypothetical protein ACJAVK_000698 [Akkermansiaceae bacterium]|jgi:hypothetical protein
MTNNLRERDEKSGPGDQSEAASHKAGHSPEGEKSGSTEVHLKYDARKGDLSRDGQKNFRKGGE